ncbi:MAG: hypothetical protein PHD04_03355 [Candidatus Pacebacteria bacterium]|nr:hypothetical protein [Candidatus Paceibacterota bacterium]
MNNDLRVSLHWFFSVWLTFLTILVLLLYLMAKVYGIQPGMLHGFIGVWLSGTLVIGVAPALMVIGDEANDNFMADISELSQQMMQYGNGIVWIVWIARLCYRRVLVPVGNFILFMVVVLPRNKADAPD